jgi:hypothetical protein
MGTDVMNYVTGGLQTAAGGLATVLGQPELGIPLTAQGASQLANAGNKGTPGTGFAQPGQSGTPTTAQMAPSLPSWINPSQIIGAGTSQAQPQAAQQDGFQQALGLANSLAPAAQMGMNQGMIPGGQQPQQQPQQVPPPQMPPPRPAQPQQPQQQGAPFGAPNAPVGTAGGQQKPPFSPQVLAMMGLA